MSIEIFSEKRGWNPNILIKLGCYVDGDRVIIPTQQGQYVSRDFSGKNPIKSKGKQYPFIIKGSSDKVFVFEGETDSISFHHHYPEHNVFAILGTENYKIIKNLSQYFTHKKIILCFNNDIAGEKCTENVKELFRKEKQFNDYDLRVLGFPKSCNDIDDFYKQFGKNEILCNLSKVLLEGKNENFEDGDIISYMKKKHDKDVIVGKFINCVAQDHEDKHPSMMIYNDGAHCFSCGYHIRLRKENNNVFSNVVNLLQDAQNPIINMENLWLQNPFFFDRNQIFWFWNYDEKRYELIDETDIMNLIDKSFSFYGHTASARLRNEYIESFRRVGRKHIPKTAPVKWVQFNSKAFSVESKNIYDVTPDYFFTNPIPWDIGESEETNLLDKLFTDWVGEKYVNTLYEVIAYCCYQDYPIQLICCLFGGGRNGKSTFLKILAKFLGNKNIASTELDLLTGNNSSRFETFKLYKKLVCLMGETNFGIMSKSSIIKRLCGGDFIGFEMKGKMPFDDKNYAKLLIASNSLPSSEDESDGFMRRWLIIDFPNEFPEGKDISLDIPDNEFENLVRKVIGLIPSLLERGFITNQGSIEERRNKYKMASNPFSLFLKECCSLDYPDECIRYVQLYSSYCQYLKIHKRRIISKKEFSKGLLDEGIDFHRTSRYFGDDKVTDTFVFGVKIIDLKVVTDTSDERLHKK